MMTMMMMMCGDLRCVQKPTKSQLCLTHSKNNPTIEQNENVKRFEIL